MSHVKLWTKIILELTYILHDFFFYFFSFFSGGYLESWLFGVSNAMITLNLEYEVSPDKLFMMNLQTSYLHFVCCMVKLCKCWTQFLLVDQHKLCGVILVSEERFQHIWMCEFWTLNG